MNRTLKYYKNNSENYINSTLNADMSAGFKQFEKYLKTGDKILDVGFGSGRDSLYFKQKYNVVSIDPIESFVENGKKMGLENVFCISAEEMNFINEFDGIWANSSLLHIEENKLTEVFKKCHSALKPGGIMWCSFKYGDFIGYQGERYFIYLTEESIKKYIAEFNMLEFTITNDILANRDLKWLNVILKKD